MRAAHVLTAVVLASLALLASAQQPTPAPDTEGLQADLAAVMQEISDAESKNSRFEGGLIKTLIETRIEILRTTQALLEQRILAVENGIPTTLQIPTTQPDPDRAAQLEKEIAAKAKELESAQREADRYTGGLVKSMKLTTVATIEQTLALLSQEHLRSTYGLALLPPGSSTTQRSEDAGPAPRTGTSQGEIDASRTILLPRVSNLRSSKQKYEEYILFDVLWVAQSLSKPARSIKGVLLFEDLFGEVRFGIKVTVDEPIEPGQSIAQNGVGFEYNQFRDQHKWMRGTNLENMKIEFQVSSILYGDGTREDF